MNLIQNINKEISEYNSSGISSNNNAISIILSKHKFYEKGISFGTIFKGHIYFNVPKQNWKHNLINLASPFKWVKKDMEKEEHIYNSLNKITKEYADFHTFLSNNGFEIIWRNYKEKEEILVSYIHPKFLTINNTEFVGPLNSNERKDEFLEKIVNEVYLKDF
jgi:hypothetical protein